MSQGMVACWLFNEGGGGVARDLCGQYHAALNSGTRLTARGLDGFASNPGCVFPTMTLPASYTVTFRVWRRSLGTYQGIISHGEGDPNELILLNTSNQLSMYATPTSPYSSIAASNLAQWYTGSVMARGGYYRIYLHGRDATVNTIAAPSTTQFDRLMADSWTGGYEWLDGMLAFCCIHARALSDVEVRQLHELTLGW